MSENFFHDNPDLEFRLEQIDLREALELKEHGYVEAAQYPGAPRNYADAKDNYAIRQAGLFGAMLPREFGGLNLPESIYSMLVEIVARAESGLMTVYGLQEIASMIEEYGDQETKARVLPRFSRGEVSGAM